MDATNLGATYAWSSGETSPSISASQSGIYNVTVDLTGCIATDAMQLNVVQPTSIDLGSDVSLCADDQALFAVAVPNSTYLWSTGATVGSISVNSTSTVWVQVTQSGVCVVSDTVDVLVQPMPSVELGADQTVCAGTTITLDATNLGATYAWSTGETSSSISASQSGIYTVTVDLNGCIATDAMQLNVVQPASIDLGPDVNLCIGDQAVFAVAAPNASYLWSTGATAGTITVNSTATIWVQVTQSGVCVVSDTVEVFVLDPGSVDLGPDVVACQGDGAILDATLRTRATCGAQERPARRSRPQVAAHTLLWSLWRAAPRKMPCR
ncbi:MAG: hypothetical protein IPJ85_12685 [Flavobacteriales bacterium]|nr:hypothetical protein [Flavobacteriales bacterium]